MPKNFYYNILSQDKVLSPSGEIMSLPSDPDDFMIIDDFEDINKIPNSLSDHRIKNPSSNPIDLTTLGTTLGTYGLGGVGVVGGLYGLYKLINYLRSKYGGSAAPVQNAPPVQPVNVPAPVRRHETIRKSRPRKNKTNKFNKNKYFNRRK